MMRVGCVVAVLLACGACTSIARMDRNAASSFVYNPDGTFRFRAISSAGYPDNEGGERLRMEMLKSWMESDGVCSKGYDLKSRRVVPQYGLVSDVNYEGVCRKV